MRRKPRSRSVAPIAAVRHAFGAGVPRWQQHAHLVSGELRALRALLAVAVEHAEKVVARRAAKRRQHAVRVLVVLRRRVGVVAPGAAADRLSACALARLGGGKPRRRLQVRAHLCETYAYCSVYDAPCPSGTLVSSTVPLCARRLTYWSRDSGPKPELLLDAERLGGSRPEDALLFCEAILAGGRAGGASSSAAPPPQQPMHHGRRRALAV